MTVPASMSTSFATLDMAAINPERGAKFSPNLFAFLSQRKHASILQRSSVYRDKSGELWMGFLDDTKSFIGVRLHRTLIEGDKTNFFSYGGLGPLVEASDFWQEYAADGRCVFDRPHTLSFQNDESRWTTHAERRSCQWCGKASQVLRREVVTTVRERWELES